MRNCPACGETFGGNFAKSAPLGYVAHVEEHLTGGRSLAIGDDKMVYINEKFLNRCWICKGPADTCTGCATKAVERARGNGGGLGGDAGTSRPGQGSVADVVREGSRGAEASEASRASSPGATAHADSVSPRMERALAENQQAFERLMRALDGIEKIAAPRIEVTERLLRNAAGDLAGRIEHERKEGWRCCLSHSIVEEATALLAKPGEPRCCCRGDVWCGDDCRGCPVHGPLCQVDGDHDARRGILHVCMACFWKLAYGEAPPKCWTCYDTKKIGPGDEMDCPRCAESGGVIGERSLPSGELPNPDAGDRENGRDEGRLRPSVSLREKGRARASTAAVNTVGEGGAANGEDGRGVPPIAQPNPSTLPGSGAPPEVRGLRAEVKRTALRRDQRTEPGEVRAG